jgi:peroxiredoxin
MDHLAEGSIAPNFELSTVDGDSFRLSDQVAVGPFMLVFYKSSCPTCQLTLPFIQQLYEGFGPGQPPSIWAVSQDDVSETRRFGQEFGLQFPLLVDNHPYAVSDLYGLSYVPTVYLIDGDGQIEVADMGFSKPALGRVAESFRKQLNRPVPDLFSGHPKLPERRPG